MVSVGHGELLGAESAGEKRPSVSLVTHTKFYSRQALLASEIFRFLTFDTSQRSKVLRPKALVDSMVAIDRGEQKKAARE